MTTDTTKTNAEEPTLADELHELEREERALEQRTEGVEWTQWIAVAIAAAALAVASFAAIIALSNDDDNGPSMMSAPAAVPAGGMGGGMHAAAQAATGRTINVQLGEMYVKPNFGSISAGKVTFAAKNMGKVEHELMVERAPIKFDGPGRPTEDAAMGMIEDMGPGGHGKMTLNLKPGKYVLFCNVTGHYAAGQHTTFTVTER